MFIFCDKTEKTTSVLEEMSLKVLLSMQDDMLCLICISIFYCSPRVKGSGNSIDASFSVMETVNLFPEQPQ